MSPAYNQYREDVGEYGAYGLSSLAKKTRTSNYLQMFYQRQYILLSYFKTCVLWSGAWTFKYQQSHNTFVM